MSATAEALRSRLLRRTPSRRSFLYGEEGGKLINPDGPDAVAALTTLAAENAALKADNDRLRWVCQQ